MAQNEFRKTSERLLNSTERRALSKLMKLHQPILHEMEKWKEHRETIETKLLDQIEMMGKILKPYYDQTQETLGHTLSHMTGKKRSSARYANKTTSGKKSPAKKSRSKSR